MSNEEIKEEVLKKIGQFAGDFHSYDFDFDGERVASDTICMQGEVMGATFDFDVTTWVRESVAFGMVVADFEINELVVWDLNGDEIKIDFTFKDLEQAIKF